MLKLLPALARDSRIPRPIRWLLVVGLLPIPGPLDEAAGLLALCLIALFWRRVLQEVRSSPFGEPPTAVTPARSR